MLHQLETKAVKCDLTGEPLKRIDGAVGHISLASVFTGIMAKLINHVTGQDMVVKGCWSETKGDPLTIREMCV